MRGFVAGFCAFLLTLGLPLASGAAQSLAPVEIDGLSFTPPPSVQAQPLSEEAKAAGVVYAAQSEDGSLRMIVLLLKARRKGDRTAAQMASRHPQGDHVTVDKPMTAGGCEFVLSAERVEEAGEAVTFRMATAILDGKQLTFFFLDRTGEHEELPRSVLESFAVLKERADE